MKKWVVDPLIAFILIPTIAIVYLLVSSLFEQDPMPLINEAFKNYSEGENASNVAERQKYFNNALEGYLDLYKRYHPDRGNGKLDYNIANSFYQLEEYPSAILYGNKSLLLRPRDERAANLLALAEKKLNLTSEKKGSFQLAFLIGPRFSLPEKIQIFCACLLIAGLAFSFLIWTESVIWKSIGVFFSLILVFVLLNLGYVYYFSPIEGVVMQSSLLYRDAGKQYAPVNETPAPSGEKVTVLEVSGDHQWLKVETPSGIVGYLPAKSLRLIQF